jgi:hypothetical protein
MLSEHAHAHSLQKVQSGDEPTRSGGHTYYVQEVAMVGYLFDFVHQSATSVSAQSLPSDSYNGQGLNDDIQHSVL